MNIIETIKSDYEKHYNVAIIVDKISTEKINEAAKVTGHALFRAMFNLYMDDAGDDFDLAKLLWASNLNKYARRAKAKYAASKGSERKARPFFHYHCASPTCPHASCSQNNIPINQLAACPLCGSGVTTQEEYERQRFARYREKNNIPDYQYDQKGNRKRKAVEIE